VSCVRAGVRRHAREARAAKAGDELTDTKTYSVPGIHCGHCKEAVTREVEAVAGVQSVDVDLEAKLVTVGGSSLDDSALRAAIAEAGYEVAA
jgi:copper chaperone